MIRSSLILAGGRGRRLEQVEKALIPMGSSTILEHTIDLLDTVAEEIIISVRDHEQEQMLREYAEGTKIVVDCYKNAGPLAGILEGFKIAKGDYVFVAACDMPYLNASAVELLFNRAVGHDAALPIWENGTIETLHAVYRRRPMVAEVEKAILLKDYIILAPVFKLNDLVYLEIKEIQRLDPELKTFMNINTPLDLKRLNGGMK